MLEFIGSEGCFVLAKILKSLFVLSKVSKMEKRGQATVYIVIAVVIVAVGLVVFFLTRSSPNAGRQVQLSDVPDYIGDCLETALMEAIYFNSVQGGYFLPPEDSVEFGYAGIPVFYDQGNARMITLDQMKEELARAVEFSVDHCVGDFDDFEKAGFSVSVQEAPKARVDIVPGAVRASLNYPVAVSRGEESARFTTYEREVPFDLIEKYNTIKAAMDLQMAHANDVPLIGFSELAYEKNIKFEVINIDPNTFVFVFEFPDSYKELKYRYAFAVRYANED